MAMGTLLLVVGASGVGKDTLLGGARIALAADDRFLFARRSITRPADAGGEDHLFVPPEEFVRLRDTQRFLAHWSAHGLHYGLPVELADVLRQGRHVVANGSRSAVPELAARAANFVVIEVTAPPAEAARRLGARGRETPEEIAARLARDTPPYPPDIETVQVANDASPAEGVARLVATLRSHAAPALRIRAFAIDTWRDHVAYLSAHCTAVPVQEFLGPGRVEISARGVARAPLCTSSTMPRGLVRAKSACRAARWPPLACPKAPTCGSRARARRTC